MILITSYKLLKQSQAQLESRSSKVEAPTKVIFQNFHLFDSPSILHYSLWFLVGWSRTNVGKKIELLWGQIEATQFMILKIQIHVSFNIVGIRRNWGQIQAPEHFFFKSLCLFFISMVVGDGPVRWGPPEKTTGVRAPVFFSDGPQRTGPAPTTTKMKNKDMDLKKKCSGARIWPQFSPIPSI